jgi:hypothetical protein
VTDRVRILGLVIDRVRLLSVLLLSSMLALCVLAIAIESPHAAAALASALDFVGDFETGDLTGFLWNQNKPEVVTAPHPVRVGDYAMRSYLHRYDSKYSYRTMVEVGSEDTNPEGLRENYTMVVGEEYWVGVSIFVPEDFVPDMEGCDELWLQFQAVPDDGELWRSPVLAIYVVEGEYQIVSRWDTRPIRSDMGWSGKETLAALPITPDKGRWVDWVFHVKWSWESDGLTEIWKDGELVVTRNGPNCSNDHEGPRPSFGVYKWPWKTDSTISCSSIVERLIYVDEFRIATADGSYEDVAPGQPAPQPADTATSSATPTNTATATSTNSPVPAESPTSTPSSTPTGTSTPVPDDNLVRNPGFEEGTGEWTFRTDGSGTFEAEGVGYEGGSAAEISISSAGDSVQLYQYEVPLRPNTDYRLEFAAKCNSGDDVDVKIHKNESPYSDYWGLGYQTYDLTSEWRVFTTYFTTTSDAGADARLRFWLSPYDSAGDVYWIDSVRLVEATLPTPSSTATSTSTPANTATSTATPTHTSTATASPTATESATPTSTVAVEETSSPTATSSPSATPTTDPGGTVIDDLDPRFSTSFSQDAWLQHTEEGGQHFGGSHHYNPQPGGGQDTATWSFVVDEPGRYEVYAWWWDADWRPSDVPYIVNHLGGSTTVRVSQRTDGGSWYPLGVFEFEDQGSVVVSDDVSSGYDVVADAIRFIYVGPLPSETATPTATATQIPSEDATATPTATETLAPGEVIIDDLDKGFADSASQDKWGEYVDAGGRHYGGAHHYNSQGGTGEDTAVWSFAVPRSGFYEVYAWWWEAAWRPPDVPYIVDHLGGRTTVRVDQSTDGGRWNLLGTFYFRKGGSIAVTDDVSSGHDVVADAVRLVYSREDPPGWGRRLFMPVMLRTME